MLRPGGTGLGRERLWAFWLWFSSAREVVPSVRWAAVASKGRPFRVVWVEGFEILIGRGDEENDRLTFEFAESHDLWLHVGGGTAGSHVVIRNPERQRSIPKAVIERAAALAAWYSKARNARSVDVHVCRIADVSKPRGAAPGKVTISNFKRVRARPAAPVEELEPDDEGSRGQGV